MAKKKRRLSEMSKRTLDDIKSYAHLLSEADREWLQSNYIDPYILQIFTADTPQYIKRRVWRDAKAKSVNATMIADVDPDDQTISFDVELAIDIKRALEDKA